MCWVCACGCCARIRYLHLQIWNPEMSKSSVHVSKTTLLSLSFSIVVYFMFERIGVSFFRFLFYFFAHSSCSLISPSLSLRTLCFSVTASFWEHEWEGMSVYSCFYLFPICSCFSYVCVCVCVFVFVVGRSAFINWKKGTFSPLIWESLMCDLFLCGHATLFVCFALLRIFCMRSMPLKKS